MKTIELKPCPFCGSTNLSFTTNVTYGHGDCGYTGARIICNDCIAAKGLSDYGYTTKATEVSAANAWNVRDGVAAEPVVIEFDNEDLTEEEKMHQKLVEKYSNMSVLEFLETFKKPIK